MNKKKKDVKDKLSKNAQKCGLLVKKHKLLIKKLVVITVLLLGFIWMASYLYKQYIIYEELDAVVKESEAQLIFAYTREFTIAKRLDETKYDKFFDLDCEEHMKDCIAFGDAYREDIFLDQDNNSDEDIYNVLSNLEVNTIKQLDVYEESVKKRDVVLEDFPISLFSSIL